MNPRDGNHDVDHAVDEALHLQLRALRQDQPPPGDLWPAIAARLQPALPVQVRQAPPLPPIGHTTSTSFRTAPTGARHARGQSRRSRWAPSLAAAATLALALGIAVSWQANRPPETDTQSLVQREAAGMTRQYRAALAEIDTAIGANSQMALQPAFDDLDRNARLILDALDRDPDSRLLLQQLRRTYAQHLALAQRAVLS